jgi:hypothetical protein
MRCAVDALVRRLQDAGMAVLIVGLDLVKLFFEADNVNRLQSGGAPPHSKTQPALCAGKATIKHRARATRITHASMRETREFLSRVPALTVPISPTSYGRGGGVGRGLPDGPGLGVGVGLGVEVGVGVGVPVGVALGVTVGVAVAVAVAVGVGLAVAVGVGVAPPDGDTRT